MVGKRFFTMILSYCCLAVPFSGAETPTAPGEPPRPSKKLIQFGWGIPDTEYLREHIWEMEKEPFDGVTFRIKGQRPDGPTVLGCHPLSSERWEEAWFASAFEDLRHLRFEKFTDNFVNFYAIPPNGSDFDWFRQDHWDAARHNIEIVVKAARVAGCKGLVLDPESYDQGLWQVPTPSDPQEFDRYARQIRVRGRQFMQAIGQQMPDATVICLVLPSYLDKWGVLDAPDPKAALAELEYALLPAFLNGMLDGLGPEMTLVDGCEAAYKARQPLDFYRLYHVIRQKSLRLVPPENVRKYQTQVQVGYGLYMLKTFSGRADPVEEAQSFEDLVYHALSICDEYVWCYNECWYWWPDYKRRLPRGAVEAILNAKDRVAGADPKTLRDLSQAPVPLHTIELPRAQLPALPPDTPPPVVDGDLSDPAWQKAFYIENFLRVKRLYAPKAQTEAWVTYDSRNLYVAFLCHEPFMDQLQVQCDQRDGPVYNDDSVDVFVSPGPELFPFYHFILNPHNVQADLLSNMKWDQVAADLAAFNASWSSAVQKHPDHWTVEMALPWEQMKMPPPVPGTPLRANLARTRRAQFERSSWSPTVAGFNASGGSEPYNFGYWTLGPPTP